MSALIHLSYSFRVCPLVLWAAAVFSARVQSWYSVALVRASFVPRKSHSIPCLSCLAQLLQVPFRVVLSSSVSFCSCVSSSLNRARSCCLSLFTPKNPVVGLSQVREARPLFLFHVLVRCLVGVFVILELVCYCECNEGLVILNMRKIQLMQVRTMAKSDNLAQASLSRLGETSKGVAQDSYARSRLSEESPFWARCILA